MTKSTVMKILKFFERNKKTKSETVKTKKPSPEQILFAETVLDIIYPTVEKFGFARHRTEIETYSTTIIFRKDKLYIKVNSSTYPKDYPFFYNIVLGEGDSEDFFEFDWNSIALWYLKKEIEPKLEVKEYEFPIGEKVKYSLKNANEELLKYGITFLTGDLNLFHDTRKKLNKDREPYKIHSPSKNGSYETTDEPKSVEQKKKYS